MSFDSMLRAAFANCKCKHGVSLADPEFVDFELGCIHCIDETVGPLIKLLASHPEGEPSGGGATVRTTATIRPTSDRGRL